LLASLAVVAAACGNLPPRPKNTKPVQIFPTSPALIAAGQPQTDGDLWFLAGSPTTKVISEISLVTGKVARTIPVADDASAIAESATGTVAVGFSDAGGTLQFRDGTTGEVVNTVTVAQPIKQIAAEGSTSNFFVLDGTVSATTVNAMSANGAQVPGALGVPLDTVSIAVTADGANVYALESSGRVVEIPEQTGTTRLASSSFFVGRGAMAIALSDDGSTLFVLKTVKGGSNVGVFDLSTEQQLRALPAPANSVYVVPSIDGAHLYLFVGTPTVGNIQVIPVG
jgi:hypothetical protein